MRWNWQQPDWPNFSYDASRLRSREDEFLKGAGVLVGAMTHLDADDRQNLSIELMTQEAVNSSAIEGEILDHASVQSSVAKHLGVNADHRRANAAEAGAAELMANLFRSYREPLSDKMLFHWHTLLMNGRRDLVDIGRYRTHADPMQIVSGALHAPKVHFEAPPSQAVPREMQGFIAWFNISDPNGHSPTSALARSGIAHLWFESIHPFEDGNGRLGRAIAEKALAQGLDAPAITALAEMIQRHRKDYYAQLQRASLSNRIDEWLDWFFDIALAAQRPAGATAARRAHRARTRRAPPDAGLALPRLHAPGHGFPARRGGEPTHRRGLPGQPVRPRSRCGPGGPGARHGALDAVFALSLIHI